MPSHSISAQQLTDMLPIGVAILNHRDEAIFTNRRFCDLMTKFDPRSFDCWSQSIHPDDHDRVAEAYHEASRAQQPLRIPYRTRDHDCPWRLLTLSPMGPDELALFGLTTAGGAICTIADITQEKTAELSQRKIAEEAQQRKTQQERFIDMISHEVRNPLSAILHCTEDVLEAIQQAREGQSTAEETHTTIAEAAETIGLCVAHQKKIVDDVLTFSKVDAGMLTLTPRRVQPRSQLATSLTMFRPELRKENIELDYKLDHSYEEQGIDWVMADLDRMSQVLINLVSNAIKFTAKSGGEMKVRVSMGASNTRPSSYPPNVVFFNSDETALRLDRTKQPEWGDGPRAYIMVAVRDTGIGISDEAQKRLFERFNQATPRTESIYGGSGLGLNVSRRLCHLHGGEIGVSSKEGEGSTFGFFFVVRKSGRVGESPTSPKVEMDQTNRKIQSLGDEMTNENHQMTSPAIPEDPEVTYIEEINPGCNPDERKDHTAKIADENTDIESSTASSIAETQSMEENDGKIDGQHILVVEDNIINQRILSRKLQGLGFSVTEASNGREALDAVKKDHFDCILMDQVMPVMDGNSATKAIREYEKERSAEHTLVLGVTANVRAEQQEEMLQSGMDDVIHKPYKMDELTEKIEHLILKDSE
jgi:signal transduction histidine kinase/ActR/RegA family two-component response regulator